MAKIPTLMINSIGNASNIISSTFTVFFIPPPALLNDNLNGNILTYNESEDAYYIQHGADAVPKKLGSSVELTLYGSYSGNRTITLPDNLVDKHFILIPTTISGTVSAGEYKNDSKPFSFSPAISKNGKTLSITGCSYSAILGIALTMGAVVSYGIYYW